MLHDLRAAVRLLVQQPLITVTAVTVLALGTGANTAVFSVINTVLLEPLPFHEADRLAMVWGRSAQEPGDVRPVSAPVFREWRARSAAFEKLASSSDAIFSLTGHGEPASLVGYLFDGDFFHVLGVAPALGRTFAPEEMVAGRHRVAVLSHRLWRTRFGADPAVLGRVIMLNGVAFTVIGVMPPGFHHPEQAELWTPLVLSAQMQDNWNARPLRVAGRLKPGVTIEQAQTEMTRVAGELAELNPASNAVETAEVVSFRENLSGDIRPALLLLMAAAAFMLLITCTNLASLLLARSAARATEMGIRRALGATRWRLVRHAMVESLVLALAGAVLGAGLTLATADVLVAMFPNNIANLSIPRVERLPIDLRVLAFTALVAMATAVAFGLAPARQAARANLTQRTPARIAGRLRRGLLVAQVALTVVLLIGAGLMLRSFAHVVRTDLGLQPRNVVAVQVLLPRVRYGDEPRMAAFTDAVVQRLRVLPGVESAGATNFLPLSGFWGTVTVHPEGQPPPKPGEDVLADSRSATPDYFDTIGIRLLQGRTFTPRDSATAPRIVIVSQSLAARFWPSADPIGRRLDLGGGSPPEWHEVIGVAADVKSFGQEEATHLDVYRPLAQAPSALVAFVVRSASPPAALLAPIRTQIWAVDPELPTFREDSLARLADESTALRRVSLQLLGGFALLALVLAAVGTYGVMAYAVSQRYQEIGIRMALGAGRTTIVSLIVGEAGRITAAGAMIGLVLALATMRLASSLLVGVTAVDLGVYATAIGVLLAVALLAGYLPARRAGRLTPTTLLRQA